MNKPTVAQLNDPQWWGVWAPEDATHYSDYYGAFVKPFDLDQWVVLRQGPKPVVTFMDTGMLFDRPKSHSADTQPAESGDQISVEWDGGGWPAVGLEIEINPYGDKWCRAKVTAYGEKELLYKISEPQMDSDGDLISGELPARKHKAQFRPLRPSEERARDELAEVINRGLSKCGWKPEHSDGCIVAVEIMAAGWRKAGEQ